jgi:hypothetical protein
MKKKKLKIKAFCCWGDGPDVLLEVEGPMFLFEKNGSGWKNVDGQLDLTLDQARSLFSALKNAIVAVEKGLRDQLDDA